MAMMVMAITTMVMIFVVGDIDTVIFCMIVLIMIIMVGDGLNRPNPAGSGVS